jgi:threonine 3-dehydrogenase
MGLFYRRKYGLDFRGVRYLSVVGPGVRTHGVDHYTSWCIEACARGNPFTIWVEPRTRMPVIYIKDAARAMLQLGQAPRERIKTVNYLLAGVKPVATAGELADIVRSRIPGAQIDFEPDGELQRILDNMLRPIDDGNARAEWGWRIAYDQERIVDDFIQEIRRNPGRYD